MVSWLVVLIWSALSVSFLIRFRNIMVNLGQAIVPGTGVLRMPSISFRPVRQLIGWAAELTALIVFYDLFGMAVVAHVTAAVTCAVIMFMLRDKHAASCLHSVQLLSDSSPAPSWGRDWVKEVTNGLADC